MPRNHISRRTFLSNASTAAAGLGLSAAVVRAAPGANERISIGMIGMGNRMGEHIDTLAQCAKTHNFQVTAICDVWQVNLKAGAANINKTLGTEPATFTRFGEMLDRKDIDAVIIATPDFGHGPMLVEALKAGKDVYIEKPMTIDLSYANQALDLARKNDRVVQCGTQHRSNPILRGVAAEVAGGAIGKISRVSTAVSFDGPRWKRAYGDCKEQDVDWDAYLLHLPKRPFTPSLLREWHLHRETSNGLPGLWMVHNVDAIAMMMDAKYPSTAVAHGGIYVWKDGRDHADTMTALLEYPEGFIFDWAMSLGTRTDRRTCIHGLDGTLRAIGDGLITSEWQLDRKPYLPAGAKSKADAAETRKIKPVPTKGNHMEDWLDCIRTRQRPRADIQFGHQHTVASIMTATALQSGQRHIYDPKKRTIQPG